MIRLHIISPDVPYPPDYGGMVDVFFKVKNLHEAGVLIYLHCFEYGRGRPQALEQYCEKVFYYPRKTGLPGLSLRLPYMMYSRRDEQLLHNLQSIDAPILFEGVHTAYYLSHPSLAGRFKLMRNQNLEQEYFALLGQRTKSLLKKLYYRVEASLLKTQESRLDAADVFLTVAEHDYRFFKKAYPEKQHDYVPSFQPYHDIDVLPGMGSYALYHGNLGHLENIEAALFLLENVCPHSTVPFIFAGKDPHEKLKAACADLPHCRLIANPDQETMARLVAEAQVHVLPTFQATGLKLKLLHALFHGRHVIVNREMVEGTGLAEVCHVAGTPATFIEQLETRFSQPFDQENINARRALLLQRYNNRQNALRIMTYLQP